MSNNLQLYKQKVNEFNDLYISRKTTKEDIIAKRDADQARFEEIDVESLEKANIGFQKFSETQRGIASERMEQLGTNALKYVMGSNYELKLIADKSRGKPIIIVYIVKGKLRKTPQDSNGGGVIDLTGLSMRVVLLEVHEPFIDGPIIFDEPCKHVSADYIPAVADFIRKIAADFGRQIILSTHNAFLSNIATKEIYVHLDEENNISIVEERGEV